MSKFSPRSNYNPTSASFRADTPSAPARRARVLFVCIGNAVRSQMAEGFARKYGDDLIDASSAGLAPLGSVPPLTTKVLAARGVDIPTQFSKGLEAVMGPFDVVVNISGLKLPPPFDRGERRWEVGDPYGLSEEAYREAATEIETKVMALILELRNARRAR